MSLAEGNGRGGMDGGRDGIPGWCYTLGMSSSGCNSCRASSCSSSWTISYISNSSDNEIIVIVVVVVVVVIVVAVLIVNQVVIVIFK